MPAIYFSKITVIESLKTNKTGRRLYEDLKLINIQKGRDIDTAYLEAKNKEEFIAILIQLKQDAEKGKWPILHIECHGLEDKSGISLANGDCIEWAELKPYFTALNVATECNLLVVMAACYGGYMVELVQPIGRAPFLAMISLTKEILPEEILTPLTAFYTELLTSLSLDNAIRELISYQITDGGYYYKTAFDIFKSVYAGYLESKSNPKAIKSRAKSIYLELKKSGIALPGGIGAIKKTLNLSQPIFFKKFYTDFFMTYLYPDNETHFNIKYSDVQKLANVS